MADSYSVLANFGVVAPKTAYPKAKEAVLKALEIDDSVAEVHTSLGLIKMEYDWDWKGAEKEYQRAIALNPSYAPAHTFYAEPLWHMGRSEEAFAEVKRGVELDPLSLTSNQFLAGTFYMARQYDQAIEQERKTLELDPNYVMAHFYLGLAYVQKSQHKEAIAEFEKAVAISPDNTLLLAGLGYAYAVSDRRADAQKMLDQLNEITKQKYVPAVYGALIYVGLGEKDRAFERLEKGYEERLTDWGAGYVKSDPVLDPLRSDPRYADLLRRMNLQP